MENRHRVRQGYGFRISAVTGADASAWTRKFSNFGDEHDQKKELIHSVSVILQQSDQLRVVVFSSEPKKVSLWTPLSAIHDSLGLSRGPPDIRGKSHRICSAVCAGYLAWKV